MKVSITNIGDLESVVAHYRAIYILIESAKKNNDVTALEEWDKARSLSVNDLEITVGIL